MIRTAVRTEIFGFTRLAIETIIAQTEEVVTNVGGFDAMAVVVAVVRAAAGSELASRPCEAWITLTKVRCLPRADTAIIAVGIACVLFATVPLAVAWVAPASRLVALPMPIARHLTHCPGAHEYRIAVFASPSDQASAHPHKTFAMSRALGTVEAGTRQWVRTIGPTPSIETFTRTVETDAVATVHIWRTYLDSASFSTPTFLTHAHAPHAQSTIIALVWTNLFLAAIITAPPRMTEAFSTTGTFDAAAMIRTVVGACDGNVAS